MVTPVESPSLFQFGVFEVDRRARELRKQGKRMRLQEQPFQVLLLLLERAGDVVTREELREKLWPSSVFVDFDHGLNNAIARLREALGDSAAAPHFIETLPRLGYRFIYPLALPADAQSKIEVSAHRAFYWTMTRQKIAASLAIAVIAGVLLGLWLTRTLTDGSIGSATSPKHPSVAVLPFVNMSADANDEHFADGLSEELANKLAGIRGLSVASQTSSFYFKNKREPVAAIAEALNVNHLLEGSVQRSGSRVKVTAQLIDAASNYHLWSETFERELSDIFRIQEDIAIAVASALQVELLDASEQQLRKHGTRDAEAYRLYLVARARISWVFGEVDWLAARQALEAAIERDPQYAAAHALLAHYHFNRAMGVEGDMELGQAYAERAVALDPELSEAFGARANFDIWRYRNQGDFNAYNRAHADFSHALELDPQNAQAAFHFARGVFWNEPDLALRLFERTLELDPIRFSAEGLSAILVSRQGRHDEGLRRAQALYDGNPDIKFHNAINIAALASYRGKLDDAVRYFREAMPRGLLEIPFLLWSHEMSLGDRQAASATLDLVGDSGAARAIGDAARHCMDGRFDLAFETLELRRVDFPTSRILDVPAARLALIADLPEHAAAILEQRLPHLASGAEPVNARNLLPALDLVVAWVESGNADQADKLLKRATAYLNGSDVPQWPMFIYLRARAHALDGKVQQAMLALDRAFDAGFRKSWAVDLAPQPFFYLDPIRDDPAFDSLRGNAGYQEWLKRIEADNALQLARLTAHHMQNVARSGDVK